MLHRSDPGTLDTGCLRHDQSISRHRHTARNRRILIRDTKCSGDHDKTVYAIAYFRMAAYDIDAKCFCRRRSLLHDMDNVFFGTVRRGDKDSKDRRRTDTAGRDIITGNMYRKSAGLHTAGGNRI